MPKIRTIGVCGVGENVGATHLSIALVSFLSGKFRKNTAYLEMNASHEIFALSGKSGSESVFSLQNVDYHPSMTIASAQKILSKRYRYVVMDFGAPNEYTATEFLCCDRSIAVGCVSPWKWAQFQKFCDRFPHEKNLKKEEVQFGRNPNIVLVGNHMGTKGDLRKLEKRLGTRVTPMPFIPDPLQVNSADFTFFESILK